MIAYKLRQTYLIELERESAPIGDHQNFEEISYKRMVSGPHARFNDANSGLFFVHLYGNATTQPL